MTDHHHIEPHKVTKPMQLLAAWLVGLIITNAIFLASAINFDKDSWERGALVVSAIVNVPIFLYALFILQTRFRAERSRNPAGMPPHRPVDGAST